MPSEPSSDRVSDAPSYRSLAVRLVGRSGDGIPEKIAARTAVAGGTAFVLSGGKFANGAITGAFAQMYNAEGAAQKLALAGAEVVASFVPGVGEAQDLYVLGHPNSAWWVRSLAGAILLVNVFTGGLLPNAGGFIRAGGHLGDGVIQVTKEGVAILPDADQPPRSGPSAMLIHGASIG